MRILSVSNCPVLEHLGSGYVIANFVNGMRALEHEVDLLQPDDYEIFQSMRPRGNSYRQAVGMLLALKRALQVKNYDIVEFWGGEAWLATGWLVGYKADRPMVVQHTNGPEPRYSPMLHGEERERWKRIVQSALMSNAFSKADAVVTVCSYDEKWLRGWSKRKSKAIVAVETALNPVMLNLPFEPRTPLRIGFCGSWIPRKGVSLLVEAAPKLLHDSPGLVLALAGVGENFCVNRYFPANLTSRVEVYPFIHDKEQLREFYRSLSILVFPSLGESFGIVVPEAMACGCAVVATRTGFASTLVDGREALLLKEASADQIYVKTRRLLQDSKERNRVAEGGWKRVQSMRWPDACRRLAAFYSEHLGTFRKRA